MGQQESELMIMPLSPLGGLISNLEQLWQCFDELFAEMRPEDWARKHGKDWICADVPYHISCYDKDWIVTGLEKSTQTNPDLFPPLCTLSKLNDWNNARMAQRPAQQSTAEAIAQMHAARHAIRAALETFPETELEYQIIWLPLPYSGWSTITETLEACYYHTWYHFMELRLRSQRSAPAPGPEVHHRALVLLVTAFARWADQTQVAHTTLSMALEFGGPGGGAWTIAVANGTCSVTEERRKQPDLSLWVEDVETLAKLITGAQNPLLILAAGKVKVRGWRNIPSFIRLFHPPKKHQFIAYNSSPVSS